MAHPPEEAARLKDASEGCGRAEPAGEVPATSLATGTAQLNNERSQSSNLRKAESANDREARGCERGGASGGQRGPGRAFLIARQFRSGYSP